MDGYDTIKTNTEFLRSKIGIVAQEPTLFDDTIGNNIKYGCLSRDVSMDEVIKASEIASLHDFVKNMELGYDSPAGKNFIHSRRLVLLIEKDVKYKD